MKHDDYFVLVLTRIPSFSPYFPPCLPSAVGPFSSVCPPPLEVLSPVCLYLQKFCLPFVLTEVLSPICLYLQKFCLPSVFVLTRIPSFSPYFPPCLPSAVGPSSAVCPPPPEVLSPVCPAGPVCPERCPSSLSYLRKEICDVFGISST